MKNHELIRLKSMLFSFLLELFQLLVSMSLLFGLFNEVFDSLALHDFINTENLIEIFLQFLSSSLDILGTLVCNTENLLLRKLWSKIR